MWKYPAPVGSRKFEFITIETSLFRRKCRKNLRHIKMSYANQLVINLLTFCFELHRIGERLPLAAATDAKMLAKRLQPVFGRSLYPCYSPFKIILLFFENLYIYYISGDGEGHENHLPVRAVCNSLPLSCNCLNRNVLQKDINFLSCHNVCKNNE